MRKKQVEFNPYIYTLSKLFLFLAMKYQFLIHNRVVCRTAAGAAVSYVKGTVSQKNEFQIISYVHNSRKYWKCKYINIYFMACLVCWTVKTVPTIKLHKSLTLKRKTKETAVHYFSSVLWNIRIQHQQTSVHWNIHPCVINLAFSLLSNCSWVHAFNISL